MIMQQIFLFLYQLALDNWKRLAYNTDVMS